MRPSTLQANSTAKPNASAAAAIQSNGRVTPTTWSSCSGFESRSMAASRKIRSVPLFTRPPPTPTPLRPVSIWPECFRFFKQILPVSAGKVLIARFLRPNLQSARGLAFAQPRRARSYLATTNSFPTSSARWLGPPRHAKRNADISRYCCFRFGLNWIVSPSVGTGQRRNDRRPARGTIGHRKGSAISKPSVVPTASDSWSDLSGSS